MRIKEIKFKQSKAIKMENECISIVILPEIGSKIASIYSKEKDFEFLFQNKDNSYKKAEFDSNFEDYDCSGFDDCFPNIDRSKLFINNQLYTYPDHGEIWSANFDYKLKSDSLVLDYKSKYFKYHYRKIITITENKIIIDYKIKNNLKTAFPAIWTMHCLLKYSKEIELNFPKEMTKIVNVQQSKYLGEKNKEHSFPITADMFGQQYRLDKVNNRKEILSEKYYNDDKLNYGKVSAFYPEQKSEFIIKFDSEKFPYLGFWLTEGSFKGDYNFAFEPTDGYYDSINLALKNKKVNIIDPQQEYSFTIEISIK